MSPVVAQIHPDRQQIAALTGLRFFAAFYVLIFHSGAGLLKQYGANVVLVRFVENGYLGVSVFFVLSGFILGYTYRDGVASGVGYAIARFARIYPVYLLSLLLALPHVWGQLDMFRAGRVMLMIQSWGGYPTNRGFDWIMQAWTLSVELVFYIAFPLLIRLVAPQGFVSVVGSLVMVASLIFFLGTPGISPGEAPNGLPEWTRWLPLPLLRLPEFVYGVLLSRLFFLTRDNPFIKSRAINSSMLLALGGATIAFLSLADRSIPYLLGMLGISFGVVIFFVASNYGLLATLLGSKVMVLLGGASYAIYLFQGPVREWMRFFWNDSMSARIAYVPLLVAISILIFLFFERPARRWVLKIAGLQRFNG